MKIHYRLHLHLLCVLLTSSFILNAQQTPFNCDFNAYLFQNNDVFALDLASGNSFQVATDVTPGNINATGYNPADGYIWGSLSSPAQTIVKIGKNFQVTTYTIPELPTSNRYVGDVSAAGVYHLKPGGATYYKVDLDPSSATYTQFLSTATLSQNISIHDWAFNAVDGQLYTLEKNSNILFRINPDTGTVINLGEVPILVGNTYTYGAVYFDAEGRFYVSANQTGTVYVIYNVQDLNPGSPMVSNLFAYGPSSSSNDGARCPTAPVPQEICDNGIDDDGDGLTDCEDPSCSGVVGCPVEEPISGGNEGGLESNNRLAQQINTRNFKRAKSGFQFNKEEAIHFEKDEAYATKTRSQTIPLTSLMPIDVLSGTQAIESSPDDLIGITNAVEILSVDYDRNDETIAALLILRTENGVYEHTKYICDRLLGAELLSVSTVTINGQEFIKSLIRNPDGQLEFVLGLSAKMINSDMNFEVESHWNLDRYETEAEYYNFQIWSNSLDDLVKLGEEVVRLLDIQRPIVNYKLSNPPAVFVKKGIYTNGALELEIINTNKSENLTLEGGFSKTETEEIDTYLTDVNLDGTYISTHTIETGSLFDIGFRIQNEKADTPDDLFLADGPWGVDDFATTTIVQNYEVTQNESSNTDEGMRVERNVQMEAKTKEYVAIYRAFTPKFQGIDLSAFNAIEFEAKGIGTIEITIIKRGIELWENQFRTRVSLEDTSTSYQIFYSEFESLTGGKMNLTDATTIVFTMTSEDGSEVIKRLELSNLLFGNREEVAQAVTYKQGEVAITPNPVKDVSTIQLYSELDQKLRFHLYNIAGQLVLDMQFTVTKGLNSIPFSKGSLQHGLYLYRVAGGTTTYQHGKVLVN